MGKVRDSGAWAIALCLIAMVANGLFGWLLNGVLYPQFAEYFGIAREIDSIIKTLLYLVVIAVVALKPSLIDGRTISAVSVVSISASAALLIAAVHMQNPLLTVVGLIFFEIGDIWAVIMLGLALCSLTDSRGIAVAVGFGMVVSDLPSLCMIGLPFEVGMVALACCPLLIMFLTFQRALPKLAEVAAGLPTNDMKLASPRSFIESDITVYACILLFNFVAGYGLTVNEIGNAPAPAWLKWAGTLVVVLWFIFKYKERGEDRLFDVGVLVVVAGLLFIVLPFDELGNFGNGVLYVGSDIFVILMWLVVTAIGRRNPYALLPVLAWVNVMRVIGVLVGAIVGHTVNNANVADPRMGMAITAAVLLFFVAVMWLAFRRFSFEEVIRQVHPPEIPEVTQAPEASIEQRCQQIGVAHGLTEREIEIFAMLARGRNGSFIQEQFVISYNTVKTHVKRIYKKLDVHSQQELIDLVEEAV